MTIKKLELPKKLLNVKISYKKKRVTKYTDVFIAAKDKHRRRNAAPLTIRYVTWTPLL